MRRNYGKYSYKFMNMKTHAWRGISPRGKSLATFGFALWILWMLFGSRSGGASSKWKDAIYLEQEVPDDVQSFVELNREKVEISENKKEIQGVKTHYLSCDPGVFRPSTGKTVLLLHGAAYSSETWKKIDTIRILCALGHKVIAVDLPGHGRTMDAWNGEKSAYLNGFIQEVCPGKSPIVVAPSFSGDYAIPLLFQRPDQMCALVAVAPTAASSYSSSDYYKVRVPTLVVRGELDTATGIEANKLLLKIPTSSKEQLIARAGHACYLNDPFTWHMMLYNFIDMLKCS